MILLWMYSQKDSGRGTMVYVIYWWYYLSMKLGDLDWADEKLDSSDVGSVVRMGKKGVTMSGVAISRAKKFRYWG